MVVYLDGKILIEINREDSMRAIALTHDLAIARGASRVEARVIGYDGRLDERFSVDVMWEFLQGCGQQVATGEITYFCRIDPEDRVWIEMLEYRQLPFPELVSDLARPRYHH
ncbi:MAG: hypothetical protein AAFS05_02470 [Pseudomonadota bacterium]